MRPVRKPEGAILRAVPKPIMRMAEAVVAAVDPDKVILFGSQARGDIHEGSDVDLLVIVGDDRDEREASAAAREALKRVKPWCDVFVARDIRLRRRGRAVGTIFRPALADGRLLYDAVASPQWDESRRAAVLEVDPLTDRERQATTTEWLNRARGDVRVAEAAADTRPPALATLCYLCQQAAEKALKAVLVYLQIDYPLSHDLDAVRDLIPGDWLVKLEYPELKWLARWAIEGRYPGNDPTAAEAQNALEVARGILASVERDLRAHGYGE